MYDGHGGTQTAQYAQDRLHAKLVSLPAFKAGDYKNALIKAFIDLDKEMYEGMQHCLSIRCHLCYSVSNIFILNNIFLAILHSTENVGICATSSFILYVLLYQHSTCYFVIFIFQPQC